MNLGTPEFWKRIASWIVAMILFSIALNLILRGGLIGIVIGFAMIVGGGLAYLNKDKIVSWYENIKSGAANYTQQATRPRKTRPQTPEIEKRPPLSQYEENTWENIVKDLQKDQDEKF